MSRGLLARLRAELAAVEAGDLVALGILAQGAGADGEGLSEPEAYEALHLQLRLERLVRERAAHLAHSLEALPHFRPQQRSLRLDIRR